MEADLVGIARMISLSMGIVKILWISRFKSLVRYQKMISIMQACLPTLNSTYQKMISITQVRLVDLNSMCQKMISIMQVHLVDLNSRHYVRRHPISLAVQLAVRIIII